MRVHLSETCPDISGSHFLEPGSDLQSVAAICETLEQVFNLLGFSEEIYCCSLECMGEEREGRTGCTPRWHKEASRISRQNLHEERTRAGQECRAAWDGQTLETNRIGLQLHLPYCHCSEMCQDWAHSSSQPDQRVGGEISSEQDAFISWCIDV